MLGINKVVPVYGDYGNVLQGVRGYHAVSSDRPYTHQNGTQSFLHLGFSWQLLCFVFVIATCPTYDRNSYLVHCICGRYFASNGYFVAHFMQAGLR